MSPLSLTEIVVKQSKATDAIIYLKSSVADDANGTFVEKKKKKKKVSKSERRRKRRQKREAGTERLLTGHDRASQFSSGDAHESNLHHNGSIDPIINKVEMQSIDDHDITTINQSNDPGTAAQSKSSTSPKDDLCSVATKESPSPSSLVLSPEKCIPLPSPIKDSVSFGSNTNFLTLNSRVEFVYPTNYQKEVEGHRGVKELSFNFKRKSYTTGIIPYVHTKLQKTVEVGDGRVPESNIERIDKSKNEPTSKLLVDEDIEDILYPERKRKRIKEMEKIKSARDKANTEVVRSKNPEKLIQKMGDGETKTKGLKYEEKPSIVKTEIEVKGGNTTVLQNGDKKKQTTKTTHCDDTFLKQGLIVKENQTVGISKIDEENERQNMNKLSLVDLKTGVLLQNVEKKKQTAETEYDDDFLREKPAVKVEQPGQISKLDKDNGMQKKAKEKKKLKDDAIKSSRTTPLKRQLSGLTVEDALNDKVGRRPRCNSTDRELNLPQRGLCDEHIVLESHKWNVENLYGQNNKKNSSHFASPRGFINLGNTCFLNATLQCLAHLPTFCQCVAVMPSPHDNNNAVGASLSQQKGQHRGTQNKKIGNGQRFTINLRMLLRKMHSIDGGKMLNQEPIAPKEIVRALSQLGGSSRGHKFRPGRQEDAHEFLVHLMDMMHDGELKAAGIDQKKSGWRDSIPIPRLEETTFVHRMFGGYLRSQVKCTHCQYSSNTYDPFLDLSLEISAKNATSISTAFAQFTRKETLDTANKWKCSGCKRRVCATKQLTCFRPPLSLCIQLKRFAFSNGGSAGFVHRKGGWGCGHFSGKGMGMMKGGSKIQKPIEFPALLKLPLSDGRKCDYELTGIVIHVGGSATSGHYTAYVRRPSAQSNHNNKWYHMDDSYVQPVSEKTVLKQKDAYLLFYCRKEVKLEIPSPPPRAIMNAGEAQKVGKARARARARLNSDLESISQIEHDPVETSINIEKVGEEELRGRMKSSILEDIPNSEAIYKKAQTVNEVRASVKMESNHTECASKTVGNLAQITTMDISKCDNVGMSRILKESINVNKNELTKNEQDIPNESKEKECLQGSTSILDNGQSRNKNSNYEKGTINNSEVKEKKEGKRKKKVVSVDMGQRGSVQVILKNPNKKKKKWKPITVSTNNLLLGNVDAKGWDDEVCASDKVMGIGNADLVRRTVLEGIVQKEKSRKRKMYPDKWDAELDKGKTKKVKIKSFVDPQPHFEPQDNPFQRMQHESMQKNKGGVKKHHLFQSKKTFSKKKNFRKR